MSRAEIESRMAQLERSNRMLVCGITAMASFGLLIVCGAAAAPQTEEHISARSLSIVDGAGRARIVLKVEDSGLASIYLRDEQGEDRGTFGLQLDNNVGINLKDSGRKDRVSLSLLPDGNTSLVFRDGQGRTRLALGSHPEGNSIGLSMLDGRGGLLYRAPR